MKILRAIWHLIVIALAVLYAVSCTYTAGADGSRSFSLDGAQAVKALEVIREK